MCTGRWSFAKGKSRLVSTVFVGSTRTPPMFMVNGGLVLNFVLYDVITSSVVPFVPPVGATRLIKLMGVYAHVYGELLPESSFLSIRAVF